MFIFGRKMKGRRVPDGEFHKRRCPECGKTTVFRECVMTTDYQAYWISLYSSETTKFACDACGSFADLDDTLPPELSASERDKEAKLAAEQAAAKAKQVEARRKKAAALAAKVEQEREEAIDDEIAAMKRKLGL